MFWVPRWIFRDDLQVRPISSKGMFYSLSVIRTLPSLALLQFQHYRGTIYASISLWCPCDCSGIYSSARYGVKECVIRHLSQRNCRIQPSFLQEDRSPRWWWIGFHFLDDGSEMTPKLRGVNGLGCKALGPQRLSPRSSIQTQVSCSCSAEFQCLYGIRFPCSNVEISSTP